MKLPRADIQFHEDVRLLVWTPHGVLNESAIEQILTLIGDMEASSRNPFNRFTDALAVEAVDLNELAAGRDQGLAHVVDKIRMMRILRRADIVVARISR